MPGKNVVGLDGTRAGWVVIAWRGPGKAASASAIAHVSEALVDRPDARAIDIPIGFPDAAEPGGRACDRIARSRLGPRRSSVFSPPVRAALRAESYAEACRLNRESSRHALGLSKQAFNILPKMREVDAVMTPALQPTLVEAHPELCFAHMNGGVPLGQRKKTADGQRDRLALLTSAGMTGLEAILDRRRALDARADDILDAAAACWTAWRIATGAAIRYPAHPETDSRGLFMEMWA